MSLAGSTQPDPLGFVDGPSVYGYAEDGLNSCSDSDARTISITILKHSLNLVPPTLASLPQS